MRSLWWHPWTSRRFLMTCGRTERSARRTGRGARGKRRAARRKKTPRPARRRRRSGGRAVARNWRRCSPSSAGSGTSRPARRLGRTWVFLGNPTVPGIPGKPPAVPGTEGRGAERKGEVAPAARLATRSPRPGGANPSGRAAPRVRPPSSRGRSPSRSGDASTGTGTPLGMSRDVPGTKRLARVDSGTRGRAAGATPAGSGTTAFRGTWRARPGRTHPRSTPTYHQLGTVPSVVL